MVDTALKGLGLNQLQLLSSLTNGRYVVVVFDYSANRVYFSFQDDDGNEYEINKPSFNALLKRGIFTCKQIYSTMQPDTVHVRYDVSKQYTDSLSFYNKS